MANLNDHRARFQLGLSNPFSTFGLAWCNRCRMETDQDTQAVHVGETYAYRSNCNRCGAVTARGIYDHVPILSRPLPAAALEWSLTCGEDRR